MAESLNPINKMIRLKDRENAILQPSLINLFVLFYY